MFKINEKVFSLAISIMVFSLFLACTSKKEIVSNKVENPVIAHRGAWKLKNLPHNSIASLREAINLKCGGTEFDVHLTADDILVVNHDQTFLGVDIERSTYKQLLVKKLDNGEFIPTAEEYLREGLKQNHTKLIYELKPSKISNARTLRAVELAVKLVKKLDKNNMVEFISFDYDALKKIKELMPNASVAYLGPKGYPKHPKEIKSDNLTGIDYRISVYKENETWIKEAHKLGLSVNAWTADKEQDMIYFIDGGADYITTDNPELLLDVWKRKQNTTKE